MHWNTEFTRCTRAAGGRGWGWKALITRNERIFISEHRTESSRRAQKNKTIDKKNYEMRKGTVEIIGGTRERILLPSALRDAGGAESLVTEQRNRGWCDP